MRAFSGIRPNQEHRPGSLFRAVFCLFRSLSLTQPNHAAFGTDIRNSAIQWVRERTKMPVLKGARSGGVNVGRTVGFGSTTLPPNCEAPPS
jgi:hypothetical protein